MRFEMVLWLLQCLTLARKNVKHKMFLLVVSLLAILLYQTKLQTKTELVNILSFLSHIFVYLTRSFFLLTTRLSQLQSQVTSHSHSHRSPVTVNNVTVTVTGYQSQSPSQSQVTSHSQQCHSYSHRLPVTVTVTVTVTGHQSQSTIVFFFGGGNGGTSSVVFCISSLVNIYILHISYYKYCKLSLILHIMSFNMLLSSMSSCPQWNAIGRWHFVCCKGI